MKLEALKPYVDAGHTAELIVSDDIYYHLLKDERGYAISRLIVSAPRGTATQIYGYWDDLCRYHKDNCEIAGGSWEIA